MHYALLILIAPTLAILLQLLTASNSSTSSNSNASSLHHRRRLQHALTGILFYVLSFILPHIVAIILLSLATIAFYALHSARSTSTSVQEYYMKHFGPLLRDHEKNIYTLPGAFWFLVGTTIVVSAFPIHIARTSLLCLSFGDPIAALVGIRIGGPKIVVSTGGSKSVSGCLACFWTCYLVAFFCMNEFGSEAWFLTGFVATFMEVFSSWIADDNVLIPVGTGTVLWLYTN